MYKNILIATDGSELAAKGVSHGCALAAALGAKVTVLTVTPPLDPQVVRIAQGAGVEDPVGQYDYTIAEEMKERFAAVEARAAEQGVTVDLMHEIDDSPAEAIVRAAKRLGCDLIVMSSHGRRGARRLILGSQTAEVVTTTDIPVLVIR